MPSVTPPSDTPPAAGPKRLAALYAVICALLLTLPLMLVRWVPSTDLPQLLAQFELLGQALEGGEDSQLRVQWWHPNKLGYLPLGLGWFIASVFVGGDPALAGRIGLALVIGSWVVAMSFIARKRSLDPGQAVLASLLVFSASFHWGFVNFLVGLPLFLFFVYHLDEASGEDTADRNRAGPRLLLIGLLLYLAHVLWLAMALLYLALDAARGRRWSLLMNRLLWLAPALALTTAWYGLFSSTGVDQRLFWGQLPWQRLHPTWLVESLFGGLQGPSEPAIAGAIILWLVLALAQHRKKPLCGLDRNLALAAFLLLFAAFLLPAVYHHTILFAAR